MVESDVGENARDIDFSVKNKWLWSWLTEKEDNGDFLSDYIKKKINQALPYVAGAIPLYLTVRREKKL